LIQEGFSAEPAVLVSLDFGTADYAENLEELRLLADSAGVQAVAIVEGKRQRPDPALYAGSGKVQEIADVLVQHRANTVIFNHDLTPAQQRNLITRLKARVIDRTALILDIFAQRAQSHEGKVQVELAQLKYLATRLTGIGAELGQQKGGIGLRGPGETRLETDRRKLARRVEILNGRLAKLKRQRTVQRRARKRGDVLSVSIVGYTNAGKSTLFNSLTHAKAYAANQLFATLDTTSRRLYLPGRESAEEGGQVVISDTVGFIRHLPHSLVAAFRATLEETVQADLLLHVVDSGSPDRDRQIAEVDKVLQEIGADSIPQILVFNKIDLLDLPAGVERNEYGRIQRIRLSAKTGAGMDALRAALSEARTGSRSREHGSTNDQDMPWH
jgi:GTP-binding protein HflX